MVPEPDHSEPSRLQLFGPRIVVPLAFLRVLVTVELNDQPCLDAAEINDVRIDCHLTTKLPSIELSILQSRPQSFLSFGRIVAECPRASEWHFCD
jgi:hypothetical protein